MAKIEQAFQLAFFVQDRINIYRKVDEMISASNHAHYILGLHEGQPHIWTDATISQKRSEAAIKSDAVKLYIYKLLGLEGESGLDRPGKDS